GHALTLAGANAASYRTLAETVREEDASHQARESAAKALQHQLVVELEQSRVAMEALPSPQAPPPAADMAELTSARRHAEEARRDAATATSALAAARTRREFLRSEEHTSELQSLAYLVCRLLLEKIKSK